MQTVTKTSPETCATLRALAAGELRWALGHAVRTFEAVPEDKLDYKPSENAKSAREIALHTLSGNGHIGSVLGIAGDPAAGATDRPAIIERLKSSTEAIAVATENLMDEQIGSMVDFFGPMPMNIFMRVNAWHIARHAGQIDYLETVWGDMQDYFVG